MSLLHKVRALFRKDQLDAAMAEEMRHHLELQEEANRRAGMTADEARSAAQRQFGNVGVLQERAREARGWVWLEDLQQDLRYAGRSLAKSPAFAFVTPLILGVGIGANTALFSVGNALLLRALPVKDPQELVLMGATGSGDPGQAFPYPLYNKNGRNQAFPFLFYEHFRNQSQSLAGIAAFCGWTTLRQMGVAGGVRENRSAWQSARSPEVISPL